MQDSTVLQIRILEDDRMKPLFVIDIETTDLDSSKGEIVEVGIARVDLVKRKVYPEYGKIVHQSDFNEDAWVFKNTDLTPSEIYRSPWGQDDIMLDLVFYLRQGYFTSYNQEFDFTWISEKLGLEFRRVDDIMDLCTVLFDMDKRFSAQASYLRLCQENPANLKDSREEHRALSDAVMESYILLAVCEENPTVRTRLIEILSRD